MVYQFLIGTEANGVYLLKNNQIHKWDTPVNAFLLKNRLFCAAMLSDNYYSFGSILNGIVISDKEGDIIQSINIKKGIQNYHSVPSIHLLYIFYIPSIYLLYHLT